MRRRKKSHDDVDQQVEEANRPEPVVIPHDVANEASVIVAMSHDNALLKKLVRKLQPDQFLSRENREVFTSYVELDRQGLIPDLAAVEKTSGADVATYLDELLQAGRPPTNVEWHIQTLLWDSARATCARGPLPAFLNVLQDPKTEPEKVRALARSIAIAFDGYEDRRYLHVAETLVRDQMLQIESRASGLNYPFGIEGLDFFPENERDDRTGKDVGGRKRVAMGAKPGGVTTVTGLSGGGKSTFTANLMLGLRREKRKVLCGAWEMSGGITLETLACIDLGWSRSDLTEGLGPFATHEGRVTFEERMHAIAKDIRFLAIPFKRRAGERRSNDRNLDIVQGYIADSGCDVFIADLWKRCLADASPEAEEDALIRQQAMAEEERVHVILVQQQRLKDIEQRPDKRPTREGIKGSGAWVEVSDTIIGVHWPALFKKVDPNYFEVFLLKQRFGRWPLGVEFEWNADTGKVWGGRSIPYNQPGEGNDIDAAAGGGDFLKQGNKKRRRG